MKTRPTILTIFFVIALAFTLFLSVPSIGLGKGLAAKKATPTPTTESVIKEIHEPSLSDQIDDFFIQLEETAQALEASDQLGNPGF